MSRFITIEGGRFELRECITCGVLYAMPAVLLDQDRKDGGYRYCPNGHQQGWSKEDSEQDKIRRERDKLIQQLARVEDEKREAIVVVEREKDRLVAIAKAETKKLKKRAAAGTCPCCQRSFNNMTEHMKKQHPKFVAAEITNVVPLKKKA